MGVRGQLMNVARLERRAEHTTSITQRGRGREGLGGKGEGIEGAEEKRVGDADGMRARAMPRAIARVKVRTRAWPRGQVEVSE